MIMIMILMMMMVVVVMIVIVMCGFRVQRSGSGAVLLCWLANCNACWFEGMQPVQQGLVTARL